MQVKSLIGLLTAALFVGLAVVGLNIKPAESQSNPAPRACTTTTVVTGGTAVTAVSGPVNGGWIVNPLTATDQGIGAAEPLYVDNTSATPGTTGNGTTTAIAAGGSYSLIPSTNGSYVVGINAATSGHKIACVRW